MRKLFALSTAALLLAGCVGPQVPATKIKLDLKTGQFKLDSPKQWEMTNLVTTVDTNGRLAVKIGSLNSKNDADVIAQAGLIQIEQMKQTNELLKNSTKMLETMGALYGKMQTGGLSPMPPTTPTQ